MQREQPPYTAAVPVDVSSVNQSFAGYYICALQSTTAGVVCVDTPDCTNVAITLPAGVPMAVRVKQVYNAGTASALLTGAVTALGFTAD
jgi:hypothetical protein